MIRVIDAPSVAPTIFPLTDLDALLAYVRAVWAELKKSRPPWWGIDRETTLVMGLYHGLNDDRRLTRHGVVFGHLALEPSDVVLDANGMPKISGRMDLVFHHASNMGPSLVLEFKRLDNAARLRRAYVDEGVDRFVTGKYARKSDLGVMVGMVKGCATKEAAALQSYLNRPHILAKLASKALSHAGFGFPSQRSALDFDTLHHRPPGSSPTEVRVGHMLLER